MQPGTFPRHSAKIRTIAAFVVILIGFQLSRSYFVIPLGGIVCLEANHREKALNTDGQDYNLDHDHGATILYSQDGGDSFQHCKDSPQSMLLELMQLLATPDTHSFVMLNVVKYKVLAEHQRLFETDLYPPFHPPRFLN